MHPDIGGDRCSNGRSWCPVRRWHLRIGPRAIRVCRLAGIHAVSDCDADVRKIPLEVPSVTTPLIVYVDDGVTLRCVRPMTFWYVAALLSSPTPTPETRPELFTVATDGCEDCHVD